MSESITVSRVIPSTAQRIYEAWLSGDEHGKMIGDSATYEADDSFTSWSGYISGQTIEKAPFTRIVQTWRSTEFPEGAPDSLLTLLLEPVEGGTKITLKHDDCPDGQGQSYAAGWQEHYFDPMTEYFSSTGAKFKEAGEAIGNAFEGAVDEASEAAHEARRAVKRVGAAAKKQAKKAVKGAKQAVAKAKKLGQKVKTALARKPAKRPAKKSAKRPSKAPAKKSALRRGAKSKKR